MERDRVLAKTLIGLRNIAWAAGRRNKTNVKAKFIATIASLLITDPENVNVISLAIDTSVLDIPAKQ